MSPPALVSGECRRSRQRRGDEQPDAESDGSSNADGLHGSS